MRALRLLFGSLGHFARRFVLIFFVGLLDGIVVFFAPVLLAEFTKTDLAPATLWRLIPGLVALYFGSHVLQWVLRRFGEAFGPQYAMHLRLRYFRGLEALPVQRLAAYHSGYLLSLISSVSEGLGSLAVEIFWGLARSLAGLSLFFYFTAQQSLTMAWINFGILVSFIALSSRFTKRMIPIAAELNQQRAVLTATYADFAANVMSVKKLGVQDFAESRIQKASDDTIRLVKKLQNFHAYRWFSLHSLFSLSMVLTISYLLVQITEGKASSSILILFIAAFISVRMTAERLSENFKMVLELDAYVETLLEILNTPVKPRDRKETFDWKELSFQNVVFQHLGNNVHIQIPEFSLRRGECVGIAGASGQGKTTFLHLLADFYQPLSGERRIDNRLYEDLPPDFFSTELAWVSQEAELFNLSLRENLLLGKQHDEAELLQAIQELALQSWLDSVEGGLESFIGEKGIRVSQGQRQRINLLRGYLLERHLFLLDEPTSQLDAETEEQVCKFLKHRLAGKTMVIVTHRERLLELCTKIYRMENNRLMPS